MEPKVKPKRAWPKKGGVTPRRNQKLSRMGDQTKQNILTLRPAIQTTQAQNCVPRTPTLTTERLAALTKKWYSLRQNARARACVCVCVCVCVWVGVCCITFILMICESFCFQFLWAPFPSYPQNRAQRLRRVKETMRSAVTTGSIPSNLAKLSWHPVICR